MSRRAREQRRDARQMAERTARPAVRPDAQVSRNNAAPGEHTQRSAPEEAAPALGWIRAFRPSRWSIWTHPTRLIVFILLSETFALALICYGFVGATLPTTQEWTYFGILAAGATIHIQLTRRQEERRRNRIISVHIDLTAVWVFPAAVVLPVPLTVLLLVVIRTQRWFTARRPAHKFLFSSISIGFAAILGHQVLIWLEPALWQRDNGAASIRTFLILALIGVLYTLSQAAFTGGFLALGGTTAPTLRNVLGSKADNALEAVTVGLGAITAILLVNVPPAVGVMAVVTVLFNRLAEIDQLQSDARTDSKTGLLNMRGWTEAAQRSLLRASRSGAGLALLMIDFDHFKRINDTYGHPAGDDVLHRVGELLTEVTRPSDTVGRYGGEEFLVLVPGIDREVAGQTAERIRRRISNSAIMTIDKRGAPVTITDRTTSIGVAVFPDDGDTLDELLHSADVAVYEAKELGRDQVRFASTATQVRDLSPVDADSRRD